jgi:PAP2 superfamily
MLKIELSWQAAAVTSACLLGTTTAVRLRGTLARGDAAHRPAAQALRRARSSGRAWLIRRARLAGLTAIAQETGIVVGLFALWQFAGRYAARVRGGALARSEWIWHAERVARLPDEAAVQRLFLPHPLLVQACNLYYASLHFVGLIALLVWLFLRHRDRYPEVRATLVMVTATSLLVQLIPVAPPRMLPSDGMIDTGVLYGQSVYGSIAGFNPDELSAMPSVHIAWALLIGITVVRFSGSRWRWLALAYPTATMLVVVVTANHFWADGIVAEVLLVLAILAYQAGRAARLALGRALRGSRPAAAQRGTEVREVLPAGREAHE